MKKIIIILSVLLVVLIVLFISIYFADYNLKLISIEKIDYDSENETVLIEIKKKKGLLFSHDFECIADNGENTIVEYGDKNKCKISIPIQNNYKIALSNKHQKTKEYLITDYISNKLDFKFNNDVVYVAVGEELNIEYTDKYIVKENSSYEFLSSNEDVVKVVNGKIIGISVGKSTISEKNSDDELIVIVTDLIIKPTLFEKRKEIIPCNRYNAEENKILDDILKSKVEAAGYGTRAGAVAAARFLTLQFPYRIPYFYENGRISDTGVNYVDGEGRYYHKGLYLSNVKMDDIIASFSGPAIWGCPLCNWEEEPYFGYYEGIRLPNGLDCSGFVSWALLNGGFDPGDIGAGETEDAYQLTDLGEFVRLDMNVLESGIIKVGDLFNYWGHISIIVGYDGEKYYVAESLPNYGGVDIRIYNKEEILYMFRYVVLMDDFYKEDGNYTEYWD